MTRHAGGEADEQPGELLFFELAPAGPAADGDRHGFGMRSVALIMALPLAR